MMGLLEDLAGIAIIVAMALSAAAFWKFDRLVSRLYFERRRDWEAAGRPTGFLWPAPQTGLLSGLRARDRLMRQVALGSHPLVHEQGEFRSTVDSFRRLLWATYAVMAIFIVLFVIVAP